MTTNTNQTTGILDPLVDLFRLSGEPFQYLNESDVHLALTQNPVEYYHFIKQRVTNIALRQSTLNMPAKILLTEKK